MIGYQKRQYLNDIIQDDVSEFKFYQGMIYEKGTQNVLNKLFDVLSADGKASMSFYEEWAVRTGQYGASSAFDNIEIILNEAAFRVNPQGIELVAVTPHTADSIIRQLPADVYVTPAGYKSAPWPVMSSYIPYLRSAGYARTADVQLVLRSINDIVTKDISLYEVGSYVWCGFEKTDWNIYRMCKFETHVVDVNYVNGQLLISIPTVVSLIPGDVIGIDNVTGFSGFYILTAVNQTFPGATSAVLVADATISNWPGAFTEHQSIIITVLKSQRLQTSINDLDLLNLVDKKENELVWADHSSSGDWATWEYKPVYNITDITNQTTVVDHFGRQLVVSKDGFVAIISDAPGNIFAYIKSSIGQPWIESQSLTIPTISQNEGFTVPTHRNIIGDVIALSPDNQWLALGVPNANHVSSNYVGLWNSGSVYLPSQIVTDGDHLYYKAQPISIISTSAFDNTLTISMPASVDIVTGLLVEFTGTAFGSIVIADTYYIDTITTNAPVSISEIQRVGADVTITSIAHPFTKGQIISIEGTTPEVIDEYNITILEVTTSTFSYVSTNTGFIGTLSGTTIIPIAATGIATAASTITISHVLSGPVVALLDGTGTMQLLGAYSRNAALTDAAVWTLVPYISGDTTYGTNSTLTEQGVILLYKRDLNKIFNLIDIILSPVPSETEQFGSNIVFANDMLFVAAAGHSNGSGCVYRFRYESTVVETVSYNPVGSNGTTLIVSDTIGIIPGMIISGVGFQSNQEVINVINLTTLLISSSPDLAPSGELAFSLTAWQYDFNSSFIVNAAWPGNTVNFGYQMSISNNGSTLAISALLSDTTILTTAHINSTVATGSIILSSPIAILKGTSVRTPSGISMQTGLTQNTLYYAAADVSNSTNILLALSYENAMNGIAITTLTTGAVFGGVNARIGEQLGAVYIYNNIDGYLSPIQSMVNEATFGFSTTISNDGTYIAISTIRADGIELDQGRVTVYQNIASNYQAVHSLINIQPERAEYFGSKIAFMNDYNTLVVYSQNANTFIDETYDNNSTYFDNRLTTIITPDIDSGRVDVYDRYDTNWVFSENLATTSINPVRYGAGFSVGANTIIISDPDQLFQETTIGMVYEYRKSVNNYSWNVIHSGIAPPDIGKIKQVFLYNKHLNKWIISLDIIDVAQGKIASIADSEIRFKTFYDPATYSVGNASVNINAGMAWNTLQVGAVWWDLRTAKFFNSYDNDVIYRNAIGNTLFPGASIDIYEWVSSILLPSDWDVLADTEAGLAAGISGTSLYSDTAYSTSTQYDTTSKTLNNTYYFWVKNKVIIPNISTRHVSVAAIAALIANPRGQGYQYITFTDANSVSLSNISPLLINTDVVLSIEYWTTDNIDQNIHTQWKLISEDPLTTIPANIEQKWIDSLCGDDANGRLVPDLKLPIKLRYGIENRPLQGMFINRIEALKQLIEQVNRVLIVNQITEEVNLKQLELFDPEPTIISGLYDEVQDTDAELVYANVGSYAIATITPVISNGRITGITIVNGGYGYGRLHPKTYNATGAPVTWYGPSITVVGSGVDAIIRSVINSSGSIISSEIVNSGNGYNSKTKLLVREYAVLVHSDSVASGNWSIYSYDKFRTVWLRTRNQSYDTRQYWNYNDWYAIGYTQFTKYDFSVNTYVELNSIDVAIGQLVKVRANHTGSWVLLEKYSTIVSIDWTQMYKVVGIQNGTIQFANTLYQFIGSKYGYDGSLYDLTPYDNCASIELRIILNSLKNDILINTLATEYLNLFFTTVRYVLSEQNYVDWIFKTSFIKAQHHVGPLTQKVTYNNDNLADFEAYISEVKPYRTKIREYISDYTNLDTSELSTTDFDLLPVYDTSIVPIATTIVDGKVQADDNRISTYPWKFWLNNLGFSVIELRIVNGGSNYKNIPEITINSTTGSGATAKAFLTNGVISRIALLTQGTGYLSAPTISINGGSEREITPARIVAVIGDSVVRSTLIKMKFDRITSTYFMTELQETANFSGTGSRIQFPLIWAPDIRIGYATVIINNTPVPRDNYKLSVITSTASGYTTYSGRITFNTAPLTRDAITVTYLKNWSLLNAADRIQYYYNPTSGELGKDLAQLMSGVDYGGVTITGVNFDVNYGWDTAPFYSDKWDSVDVTYDDYIAEVSVNTHAISLPYVPAASEEITVYHATVKHVAVTGNFTAASQTIYAVSNMAGIKVNDSISGLGIPNNTYVTSIDAVDNILTISQDTISMHSAAPLSVMVGFNTAVRIDDINYGMIWTISSTTATTNSITSTQPIQFNIGNPIVFSGTQFGNIGAGVTYYVKSIIDLYTFTISHTLNGPVIPQYTATGLLSATSVVNSNAVMATWIGDGVLYTINIPSIFSVAEGDQFILRKSTSDGSILPPAIDFDTALSGGDLTYRSALGLSADDIIVDGDSFVTTNNCPATEEVVPGQVVDALAIKVIERPTIQYANIIVESTIADGNTTNFAISQQPDSLDAVIVKVTTTYRDPVTNSITTLSKIATLNSEYIIDYRTNEVNFTATPQAGQTITLFSFGFNGVNIVGFTNIIVPANTNVIVTDVRWQDITPIVYINGQPIAAAIYQKGIYIGLRFNNTLPENSLITYLFVNGLSQTFSTVQSQKVIPDGSLTYSLVNQLGNVLPAETNMIVRVDQTILTGPTNSYYKLANNKLTYQIDYLTVTPGSITESEIIVVINDITLTYLIDYTVDVTGILIKLKSSVYKKYVGQLLCISINNTQGYLYNPPVGDMPARITFSQAYNTPTIIEVLTFYKQDILDIHVTNVNIDTNRLIIPESTTGYTSMGSFNSATQYHLNDVVLYDNYYYANTIYYTVDPLVIPSTSTNWMLYSTREFYRNKQIASGIVPLDRAVFNDSFVWVTKNGTLLTPKIDFNLNSDMSSITLTSPLYNANELVLTTFGNAVSPKFTSFMQFKDMLNRTHYKRLNANKQTTLAKALKQTDLTIELVNAAVFGQPSPQLNKPGIIDINGERIEYFSITDNTLGQLRRSTLGTGAPTMHKVGSYVQDIGNDETIPYNDTPIINQLVSKGKKVITDLTFIPQSADVAWTFNSEFISEVPTNISFNGITPVIYEVIGVTNIVEQITGEYWITLSLLGSLTPTVSAYYSVENNDNINYNGPHSCINSTGISATTLIISSTASPGILTTSDTTAMISGSPISFSGVTFGNIINEIPYYVLDIITPTSFSISDTPNGSLFALTNASGTMTGSIQGFSTITLIYDNNPGMLGTASTIVTSTPYSQSNDIDVFVGGYDISSDWAITTSYNVDDIVTIGSYTYRCVTAHISALTFKTDIANWKFFIGNIRLKKSPYIVYDVNQGPISPAGDVQFDADFAVDGVTNTVRLTNTLAKGVHITIIKNTGADWSTNTKVNDFLNSEPGSQHVNISR